MYILIAFVASVVIFGLWIIHELENAIEIDDDGNPIPKEKKTEFDKEHEEAVKVREALKLPE